jgi:Tol biopolymer transport system component
VTGRLSVLAAAVLAIGSSGAGGTAGRIVFVDNPEGDWEVYSIDADGTQRHKLTNNRANEFEPVWSPDGKRIAFVSDRDGDAEIYTMASDGSRVRQLTHDRAVLGRWDESPAWSPDGRRIAFTRRIGRGRDIYVMNADGTHRRRLTHRQRSWADSFMPVWSPDGNTIVFTSMRASPFRVDLYAMRAEGSGVRRLTRSSGDSAMAAWSPDGKRIAFVSNRDGNNELFVMNANGSDATPLTSTGDWQLLRPRWSPDGRSLVCYVLQYHHRETIYVLRADGTGIREVTEGSNPDWHSGA